MTGKSGKKQELDISRVRNIHLVGIGGCGMSAIAKVLHQMGYHVSGSDMKESVNTIRLKDMGVPVFFRHRGANLREADLVVYSSAIPRENVELQEATSQNLPMITRAEMLSWIMTQSKVPIAVCGTHGKTTTTSMLSLIFDRCGLDPTFLIGGENNDVGGNAKLGKGRYLIAEADESDGSFTKLFPHIMILTNLEADHLDYYGTLEKLIKTFVTYVETLPQETSLITHSDHPIILDFLKRINGKRQVFTYGKGKEADLYYDAATFQENQSQFDVFKKGEKLGRVILNVPGEQNIFNALAAITVGLEVGLDFPSMSEALQSFSGARRRFQPIGKTEDILIFDDYAHHPTEVTYTLQAARLGWPSRRIVAVFQPHRFTRTALLAEEFSTAFEQADMTIVSNVYSAGEERMAGVSGKLISKGVEEQGKTVLYIPKKEKICDHLMEILKPGDLLLTMGAGDIYTVAKEVFHRLKEKRERLTLA